MSLLEQCKQEENNQPWRGRPQCGVGMALLDMQDEDRTELMDILHSDIHSSVINRVLRDNGYKMGARSVDKHRRGACGCANYPEFESLCLN